MNSSFSDTCGRPKSTPDRRANPLKKRVLTDKRANPDFFRKLEGVRDSIDWQIDIAVPRGSPQEESPRACGVASSENLVYHGNCTDTMPGPAPSANDAGETSCPEENNGADLHYDQEEVGQINQPAENGEIESKNPFYSFCSPAFTFLRFLNIRRHYVIRLFG